MFINITINNSIGKKRIYKNSCEIVVTYETRIPGKNFPYYGALCFTIFFFISYFEIQGRFFKLLF